jgi:hypothetical protein
MWRTQAPLRAAFFAWSAALGKILTVDNLRKRHIIIVDKCCLCKRDGESVDHLLIHCDVVSTLWNAIFNRFGMPWVMPRRVIDLFACWWKWKAKECCDLEDGANLHFLVCLEGKKLRCFEDVESSMEDILALFFHMLYLWSMAFLSPLSISFVDFLIRFSLTS